MTPNPDLAIVQLTKAANALDEIVDINEVVDLRDRAAALQSLNRRFQLSEEIIIEASRIKICAERRMGELLGKLQLNKGGRPKKSSVNRLQHANGICLDELGISKSDSSRWKKIASLPKKKFEEYINREETAGRALTTSGVLREAKQHSAKARAKQATKRQGYTFNLTELIDNGTKFGAIYADPPWPYRNRSSNGAANNHYPTMSMSDILAEPVKEIAADKSHLHLWVPASFLREGLEVLAAWGFQYRGYFVWVKKHIGTGNYYRRADELLLFGDRFIGNDQDMLMLGTRGGEVFLDHSIRSWAEYPRREHSRKPDEVRKIVEKVSPGPYLEMYSRDKPKNGWVHYGNQILRS